MLIRVNAMYIKKSLHYNLFCFIRTLKFNTSHVRRNPTPNPTHLTIPYLTAGHSFILSAEAELSASENVTAIGKLGTPYLSRFLDKERAKWSFRSSSQAATCYYQSYHSLSPH